MYMYLSVMQKGNMYLSVRWRAVYRGRNTYIVIKKDQYFLIYLSSRALNSVE